MRVQVSARSGTITPNSSEPNRVRVAASFCRKFLISWSIEMPLGPAGRRVRAALDVAGEQLDAGQQAADAAHVVVAVAADLVADAVQDQRLVLERLERRQALLERELRPFLVGPEGRRDDAVGAEHDDQPLLAPRLVGEAEARQVQDEREAAAPRPRSRMNSRRLRT